MTPPVRRAVRYLLGGLLLGWSLSQAPAQTRLPALGDGGDLGLSAERRLGDNVAREIYRDSDYLDDPVLAEYVDSVWQPLLAAARARGELTPDIDERFAWEILLIRDRSINAFALPGGYLGVNLGLVGMTTARDELAGVLGHELSHVTQHHMARLMAQQSRQAPWVMAGMILGALALRRSPDAGQAAIVGSQAVSAQTQLNFSREMEREADRIGFGVMTQAGFDGAGVVALFDKLQRANGINDSGAFPYLRSHPLTTERIADAQLRLPAQPVLRKPMAGLEEALMAARARVLSDPGVSTLREWLAQAQQAGADAPALYAGSLAALRLRESDPAQALCQRLQSRVTGDAAASRQTRLLLAELAWARKDAAEVLSQAGQATQRPETLLRAQAHIHSGQAALASSALRLWLVNYPKDVAAWELLALAWSAQGQTVAAIRAQAEAQAAHMEYAGAVDRLKAAQDLIRQALPSGAAARAELHMEASITDARLRELSLLLREQSLER